MPTILFCILLCDECRAAMKAQAYADYRLALIPADLECEAYNLAANDPKPDPILLARIERQWNAALRLAVPAARWYKALQNVGLPASPAEMRKLHPRLQDARPVTNRRGSGIVLNKRHSDFQEIKMSGVLCPAVT